MAQKSENQSAPKADTRNLVDDAMSGADLEDQLAVIWEKNKTLITGGIAALFILFLGYQGFNYAAQRAELSVQEGFANAKDSAAKLAWAQSEKGHPLSGFAFKQLGDEAYAAAEYATAAQRYAEAAAAAESAVKQAALMGQAISLIQAGDAPKAKSILQQLANDPAAPNAAEAQYRLAEQAKVSGDFPAARAAIEKLQANISQENFYWAQKAMMLQSELPAAE